MYTVTLPWSISTFAISTSLVITVTASAVIMRAISSVVEPESRMIMSPWLIRAAAHCAIFRFFSTFCCIFCEIGISMFRRCSALMAPP